MLMMIKTYNPFKKEKITPSDPYLVIEKDHKSELHKDVIITPTPTAKSTPINSSHYIQEFIFPSSQNLQFFRNDIIPESKQSNSYHNNSYPSNFSSKFVESEIKKDDKDEIMTYIRCLFHDFRSPLNNISMGIDILDETILKNEETQEIINNMKESSKFITNALNGFLNIKNIISGNTSEFIQINNKNFNIIECIKKSEKLMLYKIKSKRLKIEYKLEIPENYQNVYGDSSNLQHVFMNLLSNAVKFSENDTKITIILMLNKDVNKENNTEKIRFTYMVIDENKHIEPEIKRILFQKYNTSNTSTGTGLGLYICKNIIELYDGRIEHEYNNPIGNIFRVEFGLEVGKPTTHSIKCNKGVTILREGVVGSPRPTDAIGDASRPQTVGFPTIYIVDDCAVSRKMLRTLLHKKVDKNTEIIGNAEMLVCKGVSGINILEECDGLDLLKKIEQKENLKNTNIIFIDNQMPNLNGTLTTKLTRALGYKNYIIGITGNNDKNDIDEFKKNGADYVFTKPFTKDNLDELFYIFAKNSYQKPSM